MKETFETNLADAQAGIETMPNQGSRALIIQQICRKKKHFWAVVFFWENNIWELFVIWIATQLLIFSTVCSTEVCYSNLFAPGERSRGGGWLPAVEGVQESALVGLRSQRWKDNMNWTKFTFKRAQFLSHDCNMREIFKSCVTLWPSKYPQNISA